MKFCSKCGKEVLDEAIVCPNCGCAIPSQVAEEKPVDEISVGLCILSALIPLFGIIYWPVTYKKTPKRAQACGITALIAWFVSMILTFAGL